MHLMVVMVEDGICKLKRARRFEEEDEGHLIMLKR